jgi:hypothetical protein
MKEGAMSDHRTAVVTFRTRAAVADRPRWRRSVTSLVVAGALVFAASASIGNAVAPRFVAVTEIGQAESVRVAKRLMIPGEFLQVIRCTGRGCPIKR